MSFENNTFYKSDYENAQLAFSLWQGKQHETLDEYMLRKRKIELNCLVREVIENELSDTDKIIVQLHWYDNKTINQIAEIIGIDRSNVSRRLDKINGIIYSARSENGKKIAVGELVTVIQIQGNKLIVTENKEKGE